MNKDVWKLIQNENFESYGITLEDVFFLIYWLVFLTLLDSQSTFHTIWSYMIKDVECWIFFGLKL